MLKARDLIAAAPPSVATDGIPQTARVLDARFAVVPATVLLVLLLLLTTSPWVVTFTMIGLAVWAVLGPGQALQALALASLVRLLNPGLVQQDATAAVLTWVVLLVAGLRVLPGTNAEDARRLGWLWGFAMVAAALSAAGSPLVTVSLMKVATFAWAVSTILVAWRSMPASATPRLVAWFATLAMLVVGLSAATVVEPAVAYRLTGTGLQGITLHPQALAVLTVPAATFVLTSLLLRAGGPRTIAIAVTAVAWVVLIATEARTGLLAAFAGTIAGLIMHAWQRQVGAWFVGPGRLAGIALATVVVAGVAVAAGAPLLASLESFLLKRSGETTLAEAFERSRGGGVVAQWRNFRQQPLSGHGFGVYPQDGPPNQVVEYAGIPVSAPVEKGFLPTAVLEESGLPGALLLALALFQLGRMVWRGGDPRWFALFAACLATNVGEATLLSPGGPGMLLWCVIGLCVQVASMSLHVTPHPSDPGTSPPVNVDHVMR